MAASRPARPALFQEPPVACESPSAAVRTTNSEHAHRVYPNLAQNLFVTGPNQLWVADITYIAIRSGFVYLAVILDLFARRVVGYALSRNIDTALCLEALQMALARRRPPAGIIHHSDRGVQYASRDYVEELLANGFRISMARKGNPYDNAAAESFIKTLALLSLLCTVAVRVNQQDRDGYPYLSI